VMFPRFALVPEAFFSEESARTMLEKVVPLSKEEPLSFTPVPTADAMMIYAGERPAVYDLLLSLPKVSGYNKILARYEDGILSLVVADAQSLQLCNAYHAQSFTTAEYFIFLALRKLQINPEISVIHFTSPLSDVQVQSLLSYFKSVETLR